MNVELLKKKEQLLEAARNVLKKEFIGIDDIIDNVIDNTKSWFLFPELQERPLVISAFGLTGVGKTALVKRLAQLLDIERDMVYFNFAEIGELSSWEIERKLEEELGNERSNRMFVYDEIQYAATIDETGKEKDKKSGLKPFWELLDSGKLHKRDNFYSVFGLYKIRHLMEKISEHKPMLIKGGVWVNSDECLATFSDYERNEFLRVFCPCGKIQSERRGAVIGPANGLDCCKESATSGECPAPENAPNDNDHENFFLTAHSLDVIFTMYERVHSGYFDSFKLYHELCDMTTEDFAKFITELHRKVAKGYDLNFKDSIIFVLGNLDEAYTVAFDTNPDMSPDQFNKVTKKITVVEIKEALKKRFRVEQIARLGNIFLIYPAFSSDSFRKIIDLNLNKYAEEAEKLCGYEIHYTDSIRNIIYREAVFPTHGTRPLFSTIHEIVKTKLPNAVKFIYENGYDAKSLEYSHRNGYTYVAVKDKDGNPLGTCKFKEKLQLESLRKSQKNEMQALVAAHESGHFVMYSKLTGEMPEKLCSKTASVDASGFLMKKFDEGECVRSLRHFKEEIMVALAGYVAEKIVFGEEYRSCGASADLASATRYASMVVRKYGLTGNPFVTTYMQDPMNTDNGLYLKDTDVEGTNKVIIDIINTCINEVERTLRVPCWRKMLKESAMYLKDNSDMPRKKMEELYAAVPESMRKGTISKTYYRDKLSEF